MLRPKLAYQRTCEVDLDFRYVPLCNSHAKPKSLTVGAPSLGRDWSEHGIRLQMLTRSLRALRDYKNNPDPLAALANTVALVVAGNQPFYPLYLHAIVGASAWPAWITLITMPLFATVPAVARLSPLLGRAMLPTIGTANGILAVKLIGTDTGVQLFLLPCVLLATILFRPGERLVMLAVLALPFAAYILLDRIVGTPLATYSAAEYRSMVSMHAFSVASLFGLIGYAFPARTEIDPS